jgi:hypothetical protein
MALVQILTDEDITGYAFLGNSMASIGYNAQIIIEKFKPVSWWHHASDRGD